MIKVLLLNVFQGFQILILISILTNWPGVPITNKEFYTIWFFYAASSTQLKNKSCCPLSVIVDENLMALIE